MFHTIKIILHCIIIFQCLFFSIYLLSHRIEKKRSNMILSVFLFVILIIGISGVIEHFPELHSFVSAHHPHLAYIFYPFRFLYVPLLYLYVLSFSRDEFRFKPLDAIHALPFLAVFLWFLLWYLDLPAETLTTYLLHYDRITSPSDMNLLTTIEIIQFMVYAGMSLVLTSSYRRRQKLHISPTSHTYLGWLTFVVYGFIIWQSLSLTITTISTFWGPSMPDAVYIALYISSEQFLLMFLSAMFFKGLKHPAIFSGANGIPPDNKYQKVQIPTVTKEEYRTRLLQFMDTQKPHLDPSLSLKNLAEDVAIPPHHLSQVLNTTLEQNFFDFINTYRVNESIKILTEESIRSKTVSEVLYQSGFNSKSVFYSAFKKHTGMTPSQFRKQHQA